MIRLMAAIKCISRCSTLYRAEALEAEGLGGYQQTYLLHICEKPGITQEELARRIYVNKSNCRRQVAALGEGGFVTRSTGENRPSAAALFTHRERETGVSHGDPGDGGVEPAAFGGACPEEQEAVAGLLEKMKDRAVDILEKQREGRGEA